MMMLFFFFAAAVAQSTTCETGKIDINGGTLPLTCEPKCKTPAASASADICEDTTLKCVLISDANKAELNKFSPIVTDKVAGLTGRFCKKESPRCFKATGTEAAATTQLGKCENKDCVKQADGTTACTETAATEDCFCKKPKGSSGLSSGAIAGIVIGSIIGVAALSVGGYFLYKHLTKSKKVRAHKKKKA